MKDENYFTSKGPLASSGNRLQSLIIRPNILQKFFSGSLVDTLRPYMAFFTTLYVNNLY